jgi:hypothetical protein
MPNASDTDIRVGGHSARHTGKGRTSDRLMSRPDLKRADSAAPAVRPNEPVQGGWQSPVKEDRR